jgi:hypothetical protein
MAMWATPPRHYRGQARNIKSAIATVATASADSPSAQRGPSLPASPLPGATVRRRYIGFTYQHCFSPTGDPVEAIAAHSTRSSSETRERGSSSTPRNKSHDLVQIVGGLGEGVRQLGAYVSHPAMIDSVISPAMRPYSMAVAPVSSRA